MKKGVLILLGMFMMVSTVEAKKGENLPNRIRVNYSYNDAVNFIERGIEFYVFTNGDFDFNTHLNDSYYDNGYERNNSVRINRDYRGRIRSIGNVYINYDRRGNVTKIGNIFIKYYRGQLTKVGNLRVRYNRSGYPIFYGNVRDYYYNNGIRFNISFGDVFNYSDPYFFKRGFKNNYSKFREDRNFYYYKANKNAKIGERSTIIKRRKQTSNINKRKVIKRNSNNSYRKPSNTQIDVRKGTKRSYNIKKNDKVQKTNKNARTLRTNRNTKRVTSPKVKRNSQIKKEIKNSKSTKIKKNSKKDITSRKRRS